MAHENEGGDFATLLKAHPKSMHGHKVFHRHSIKGKGSYNWHQSRDVGIYGQEIAYDEAFNSNNVAYREGWCHGNTGFKPASNPYHTNKDSNGINLLPPKNNKGLPKRHRGHYFGFRVQDNGHHERNAQVFGDRLHSHVHGRNNVRGRGRGTHGRCYYRQGVSNYNNAERHNFHGEEQDLQPDSGSKQIKNKFSPFNHGESGRRGHCFHGSFKRVGVRSGIGKVLQFVNNKVNVSDFSPVDVGPTEQCEHKNNDGNACSTQAPRATEDDGSVCMENEVQDASRIQGPSSNTCSQPPVLQGNESQKECVPVQKDSMIGFGDQGHLEKAFILCGGGTRKRRRLSAVRDFPVRSGKLHISSVKKVIIKSKDRKSIVCNDLVLEGSVQAGCQSGLAVANEILSFPNAIVVPADCNHIVPELTIEDCRKSHLGMVEGPSDLVGSVLKTSNEIVTKIIGDEGNASAKLTEVSPGKIVENCNSLTSSKGNSEDEEVRGRSEVEICSKTFLLGKDENSFGTIEADLPKITLQILDRKEIQNFENSSQIPSPLTHVEIPEGSDAATRASIPTSSQGNEHSQPKERKKNRRTDMQAVGGRLKFKSPTHKVSAALTEGLHKQCHVKVKVQDSLELFNKMGALLPYQITGEGNMRNKVELTEVSHEKTVEDCGSLTLSKKTGENEHVPETREVEICNKTLALEKGAGFEDSFGTIEADLSQPTVQNLDRKDARDFENSSQIRSILTHVRIPEASDVATRVSMPMSTQANELSRPKERKKNKRTDMQAVGGLLKSKSQPNKVCAALTDGLHNHSHVPKNLNVQDSPELMKETGALIPYQSNDGGNMKNKDFGRKLVHKGSSRAKLFQTSRSFDPNDAANLLTLEASEGLSDRALVKRTLHEFEYIRKALVKSHTAVKRADLDAGALLREKGKWRNCAEKIVGEVPGVEVGDQFSFRMEMLIIGLHRQVQSGIDYIPGTKRLNRSPLATSIVASGGYEDDKDDGNTLIYSGQGGINIKGNKKQESNQELVRGNLALSNSMKEKTPVRVIRGTTDLASPSSKVYTYDGLYDVVNFAFECGTAGFWVYQFTLTRRPGQPQVGLSFLSNLKKKGLSRPNLLLNDISRSQERLPVCVVNEIDEEPAPIHFSYIPSIKYPIWYSPLLPEGCQCAGVCDEDICSCSVKNGGEFPYNEKGYIMRHKKVVYECGTSCGCSGSCPNRVSQKGLRYRLEIFKTKNRGWGVRSLDSIQPGGFICEYTGELLSDAEAEQRIGNDEYLFELGNDCNPSVVHSDLADVDSTLAIVPVAEDIAYTIDAKDLGNVARFINHSCSPNLYAQNVLYDSDDLRFPHVMLFAMENIPPLRELTYDYHYSIDQVRDAHGNVKTKACYCGAEDCEGRLY